MKHEDDDDTRLTAIFQDIQNVSILDFIGNKDDGMMVTTATKRHAKLQSNNHNQQTNTQLFTDRMPFLSSNQQCQRTEGRKNVTLHRLVQPKITSGLPTLSFTIKRAHWLVPNYTAWWQRHLCKQLAQGCSWRFGGWDSKPWPVDRKSTGRVCDII